MALVLAPGVVPAQTSPPDLEARLADTLPRLLEAHQVPGAAVAFVSDQGSFVRGFGVARADGGPHVTPGTVFEAASLSKPVFALAVRKLVASGHLELRAPLETAHLSSPLTPLELLSHTAGLPNWSRDEPLELETEPGTGWRYSGQGYVLLQQAVEAQLGRPLQEVVDSLVFSPLEMRSSSYLWRSAYDTMAARGHDASGRPVEKWRPNSEEVERVGAASSLHTTATDLQRFLDGVRRDPDLLRWIVQDPVPVSEELGLSWGLGWAVEEHPDGTTHLFHWGANPAFRSFMMVSGDGSMAFALLANGADGLELADEVAHVLTGRVHPLFDFYMLHPTD